MRRLITLHIGRGLELYPRVPTISPAMQWLLKLLGLEGVDLPSGRAAILRWGLHPADAAQQVAHLLASPITLGHGPNIATNDASTINALCEALSEGELRVVSHSADGTVKQWDVDQMMAFWQARAERSEMTPAAMLIKLGVWT